MLERANQQLLAQVADLDRQLDTADATIASQEKELSLVSSQTVLTTQVRYQSSTTPCVPNMQGVCSGSQKLQAPTAHRL